MRLEALKMLDFWRFTQIKLRSALNVSDAEIHKSGHSSDFIKPFRLKKFRPIFGKKKLLYALKMRLTVRWISPIQ
jgi:hypothetical protein